MSFQNSSSSQNYHIRSYMILDGTTSNVTTSTIESRLASLVYSSTAITIQQRTNTMIAPGTYNCDVYAYVDAGADVNLKHVDLFIMGNIG